MIDNDVISFIFSDQLYWTNNSWRSKEAKQNKEIKSAWEQLLSD